MRTFTAVALAVLTAAALAAAPAPATAGPHFGGGGFHGGHGGFGHGGWGHGGWGGPGLAFGIVGGIAATALAADAYCVRYQPTYDAFGNYMGSQPVNVC